LQRSAKQLGVDAKRISDSALKVLSQFAFPGNVRQLENVCHWLTVMAPGQLIETKDLPPEMLAVPSDADALSGIQPSKSDAPVTLQPTTDMALPSAPWEEAVQALTLKMLEAKTKDVWNLLCQRFETAMIEAALIHTDGRKVEAANKLGMGRNTMTRKIQELGLE
jgi:two-component system, NtrC family, nitrogen regulation response regulator GlnG